MWIHTFTFLCDYYQFFLFPCQDANMSGSHFAITGCNLSWKIRLALETMVGKIRNLVLDLVILLTGKYPSHHVTQITRWNTKYQNIHPTSLRKLSSYYIYIYIYIYYIYIYYIYIILYIYKYIYTYTKSQSHTKYKKPLKNITVFNLIQETIQHQICERSHNEEVFFFCCKYLHI